MNCIKHYGTVMAFLAFFLLPSKIYAFERALDALKNGIGVGSAVLSFLFFISFFSFNSIFR